MKPSVLISALSAATVMASPPVGNLNRAFMEVAATPTNVDEPTGTMRIACIECPCDGFSGDCPCIFNGCCCDPPWTVPGQPPATGFRAASDT